MPLKSAIRPDGTEILLSSRVLDKCTTSQTDTQREEEEGDTTDTGKSGTQPRSYLDLSHSVTQRHEQPAVDMRFSQVCLINLGIYDFVFFPLVLKCVSMGTDYIKTNG